MPGRRDRDDAVAAELERVAAAVRSGEAAVYGYDVRRDPKRVETGAVSYPGGWFEFRIERDGTESRDRGGAPTDGD